MQRPSLERPEFESPRAYGRSMQDVDFWRTYVREVCTRHGLEAAAPITACPPGTNAVFAVGERWIVKLFTEFFDGARSHPAERETYRLLSRGCGLAVAALVAEGSLFPDQPAWPWPYLVLERVPGEAIGLVREQVGLPDLLAVAAAVATTLKQLHALPLDGVVVLDPSGRAFERYMQERRRQVVAEHRRRGTLPERLVAQIEDYLPPMDWLLRWPAPPHLLHCDVTADHVLVQRGTDGRWRFSGLIDFGDARVGNTYYELTALHLEALGADKRLLRRFLDTYGLPVDAAFQYRAMSYALLFEFDSLRPAFQRDPALAAAPSLNVLATLLWDTAAS